MSMATTNYPNLLVTAGGRLLCAWCTAKSKTTGLQCGRPAQKVSKTQKCQFHGGRNNSGPKTPEGKAQQSPKAHDDLPSGQCYLTANEWIPFEARGTPQPS